MGQLVRPRQQPAYILRSSEGLQIRLEPQQTILCSTELLKELMPSLPVTLQGSKHYNSWALDLVSKWKECHSQRRTAPVGVGLETCPSKVIIWIGEILKMRSNNYEMPDTREKICRTKNLVTERYRWSLRKFYNFQGVTVSFRMPQPTQYSKMAQVRLYDWLESRMQE